MTEQNNLIEDELDTGHDYDGIRELDNRLPNWWLMTLWGAVFFAIGYWTFYHGLPIGNSLEETLSALKNERSMAEQRKLEALIAQGQDPGSDEILAKVIADEVRVKSGKTIYDSSCIACHKADGGGLVGPNLTDNAWIHGAGRPADLYRVINKGSVEKGMPAWGQPLGVTKVQDLVAYVSSIKNTNVDGGKAPQGEIAPK